MNAPVRGYEDERAALGAFVAAAARGQGSVLRVTGEPGTGKTSLLTAAVAGFPARLVRLQGQQSDSSLPFTALSDLVRPILDRISGLPAPQRLALGVALAIESGPPPEPLAIRAATFNLLAELEGPTLVAIDDWQWLDPSSVHVVAYLARRLAGTAVSMLAAGRYTESLEDLPHLELTGLDRDASTAVIADLTDGSISPATASRIHDLASGNPLVIAELVRTLPHDLVRGPRPWPARLRVDERIRRLYRPRLDDLPGPTRLALLVVAASAGDPAIIAAALQQLGRASLDDLAHAERAGLLHISSDQIRFRHPLLQSTVYDEMSAEERRTAHQALGIANRDNPDRQTWHRSAAVTGPDPEVAAALAALAERALARSGAAEAGRAYDRAAELAATPSLRRSYHLAAARAWYLAGYADHGRSILDLIDDDLESTLLAVEIDVWNGYPERARERAVQAVAGCADLEMCAAFLLLAALASMMLGDAREALEFATAARGFAPEGPLRVVTLAVEGQASLLCGDFEHGRRSVTRVEREYRHAPEQIDPVGALALMHGMLLTGQLAPLLGFIERYLDAARRRGTVTLLPLPLTFLGDALMRCGRFDAAEAALTEAVQLCRDLPQATQLAHSLALLARLDAYRGREAPCREHAAGSFALADRLGVGAVETHAGYALGLLEIGAGQWQTAIAPLERVRSVTARSGIKDPSGVPWAPDLVEAYARTGERRLAQELVEEFEEAAARAPTPWSRSASRRCRGLVDPIDGPELLHEAITDFEAAGLTFDAARTRVALGHELRRRNLRTDAIVQLELAVLIFDRVRAVSWAARGREELQACGGKSRTTTSTALSTLTAQELRIVKRVASGATNREVATDLFLSPKTVENHLSRIYPKLSVRSRTELATLVAHSEVLSDREPTPRTAGLAP